MNGLCWLSLARLLPGHGASCLSGSEARFWQQPLRPLRHSCPSFYKRCIYRLTTAASRQQPDPSTQRTRQAAQSRPLTSRQLAQPPGALEIGSTLQQRRLELNSGQQQQAGRQQQPGQQQRAEQQRQAGQQQQTGRHLGQRQAGRQQAGLQRGQQPQPQRVRPRFRLPVVVEGLNDRTAVHRAVDAEVYVLGGATKVLGPASERMLRELQELRAKHGGLVILTDSDVAGRQGRSWLEGKLPGCFHAFVPAPLATSAAGTEWHEAGNVGVEHAPPSVIIQALRRMRRGEAARTEFSREDLIELGLVAPHHLTKGGDFAARRALVCAFLGIGNCDGKQLLRQLNAYGFTQEDLKAALSWSKGQLRQQGGSGETGEGRA